MLTGTFHLVPSLVAKVKSWGQKELNISQIVKNMTAAGTSIYGEALGMKGNLWLWVEFHILPPPPWERSSFPLKMPSEKERSKRIINRNWGSSQKAKMGFHSCPSREEEIREERWQPREGRTERGDRREKPELLPLHVTRICGSPWINYTQWKGLDLSPLTSHIRGLPCRRGVPNHKRWWGTW